MKEEDISKKSNEFKFLKSYQFNNFPKYSEYIIIIIQLLLLIIIIQFLNLDIEFINKIKIILSIDLNINFYIINLQDSIFSHEENIQFYLEFYIIYNNLILRNELIYISNNNNLKL